MSDEFFTDERDSYTLVDRSTLERYANCPMQARLCETEIKSVGTAAEIGTQIHDAASLSIQGYIDASDEGTRLSPTEIAGELETNLQSARPDVQSEVMQQFRGSIYPFSRWLQSIDPRNILRFDGGRGEQTGQLAWDVDWAKARVTSELDMLHSTASIQELQEVDLKSGWSDWTAERVASSFQFQLHAALVFQHYPDVQILRVSVWSLKRRGLTSPVEFNRRDKLTLETRVNHALMFWAEHRNKDPHSAPAWPSRDKCRICDAAALCRVADVDIRDAKANPGELLQSIVATEAKLKERIKTASAIVDATGQDIFHDGIAFGTCKPPSRKPSKSMYAMAAQGDEDE